MVLFSTDGALKARYRKMVLVPFGEYSPLEGVLRWPQFMVANVGKNMAGNEYTLFQVGPLTFGAVVCWENIFPDHVREFVKRGAQFMVSATNEA